MSNNPTIKTPRLKNHVLKIGSAWVILSMLSACAGTLEDAPSLNKREFEISLEEMRAQIGDKKGVNEGDVVRTLGRPLRVGDALAILDEDINALWKQHETADAVFNEQSKSAQNLISKAAGSDFGSESWSVAHVTLSRLEKLRAPSIVSLDQVDKRVFELLETRNLDQKTNQGDDYILDALLILQRRIEGDIAKQTLYLDNLARLIQS